MVSAYMMKMHQRWFYSVTWLAAVCYIVFFCPDSNPIETHEDQPSPDPTKTKDRLPEFTPVAGLQTILLWTSYYGSATWNFEALGVAPFDHELCELKCYVTRDRRYLPHADAILFNYADADFDDWPVNISSKQLTVLVLQEPPTEVGVNLYKFEKRVQFVMSYRQDSDIYAPPGITKPVTQPMPDYIPRVPLSARNRTVAWVTDTCDSMSQRERYIKELSKYISIDTYGKCGKLQCPEKDCMSHFAANYNFILAFESTFCKDYVTAELFQALSLDVVPVVFSEAKYPQETLSSLINAMEFASPKALAKYLTLVSYSEGMFNRFFQNRLRYRVIKTNGALTGGLCKLCDWLHNKKPSEVVHYRSDLATWWNVETCHNHEYIPKQEERW